MIKQQYMQTPLSKQLFEEATEMLDSINQEINRPVEDSVGYLICQRAKHSVGKLLSSFILSKGGSLGEDDDLTPSILLEKCTEIDPAFKNIPISTLNVCNKDNYEDRAVYCLSPEKALSCLQVANQLRELVVRIADATD